MNGPDPGVGSHPRLPDRRARGRDRADVVGGAAAGKALAAVPGRGRRQAGDASPTSGRAATPPAPNCPPIPGATSEKYVPDAADVGHGLSVVVSARARRAPRRAVSGPTAAVAAAGRRRPSARPRSRRPLSRGRCRSARC